MMKSETVQSVFSTSNKRFEFNYACENDYLETWIQDNETSNSYSFGTNLFSCENVCKLLNNYEFDIANKNNIIKDLCSLLKEYNDYVMNDGLDNDNMDKLQVLSNKTRDILFMCGFDVV